MSATLAAANPEQRDPRRPDLYLEGPLLGNGSAPEGTALKNIGLDLQQTPERGVALRRRRSRKRAGSKVALACAGGGITGAIYEIGCLRALEDLLERSVLDFDLYLGISGGAFVSSLLANGISPVEMYDEVATGRPFGLSSAPIFRLGLADLARCSTRAPRVLRDALLTALTGEGRNLSDLALSLFELLPAGLLDNSGIQEFLAHVFRARGRSDRFDDLVRELLLVAVDLDSGEAVAFGEEGHRSVPISKAVQASTAMPGLYRPVRLGGRDYVDGGVKKTAHINLAIRHGADLVICINPIVPILNRGPKAPLDGHLSNKGVSFVLDQVFRIMLHGRMQYGMERYETEHPDVDILLIEPTRDDMRMFGYNIMRMSARKVVAEDGYRSVVQSFRRNRARYERVLKRHGIRLGDPSRLPAHPPRHPHRSLLARSLASSLDLLDAKLG
ncbi:MAG TPA: patatin-like phospholipase family protein [Vicinamibacteria bacterium]|nr:patatin-like phospholipase family protein [Vicinamibacteria bacterium]